MEQQLPSEDVANGGGEPKALAVASADVHGDRRPLLEDESEPRDVRSILLACSRVAASAAAHILAVLWVAGLFATAPEGAPIEAVPVELVAVEDKPPPPPPAPPKPAASEPPQKQESNARPLPENPAPGQKPSDARPQQSPEQQASTVAKPSSGTGIGGDDRPTTLSEDERNALIAQVVRCWTAPRGWTDARQVSPTVRFRLKPDGTLDGVPVVVEFHASLLGKAAADDAVKALKQCGPYHMPPDKYAEWSDVQMRFVP